MERKDFGISCFQALLFLIEVALPGFFTYALATVLFSDVTECVHHFYHVLVPSAGISSGFDRALFSSSFFLVLARAVLTQIHATMFVISFAALCRPAGLFRARARAILAGLRRWTVPVTFFQAVVMAGNYVAVLRPAFRVLNDRGELELPVMLMLLAGGAVHLGGAVCVPAICHLSCAVPPVLEDASASGFGAMRTRLALVGARKCWAMAAVQALLGGIFAPMTVLMARAFPSFAPVYWMTVQAVMCTMAVVMLVAQPVLYLVVWDGYHTY